MPLTSFYTALTGLNTNSAAINVIGDNLANMNTVAFKSGKASFSELLAGISGTSATGNPISTGLGATLNGVIRNNSQGVLTNTSRAIDAAINGNGYFVVSTDGGMGYTRSGQFQLTKEGNFVSGDGFQVMGYTAQNGVIDINAVPTAINIRTGQSLPAIVTTNITVGGNLNTTETSFPAPPVRVVDSLGVTHDVTLSFNKISTGNWSWTATIPAGDVTGAPGTAVQVGTGQLQFDSSGILTSPTTSPSVTLNNLASGAAPATMTLSLFNAQGVPTISSNGGPSSVPLNQDGMQADTLQTVSVGRGGIITGTSASGRQLTLAQLAMATFPNQDGLLKYEGSTYTPFVTSGEPCGGIITGIFASGC